MRSSFQFLLGRLKTHFGDSLSRRNTLFQFLLGRLKTWRSQLLQRYGAAFQFLLGRLKTLGFCARLILNSGRFNSC